MLKDISTAATAHPLLEQLTSSLQGVQVQKGDKIAVGVSGGADSMALALLLAQDYDVHAFTVDHGLRDEAAGEAVQVGAWLSDYQIRHDILNWRGEKPVSNVQAVAREIRYGLLAEACTRSRISKLAVAHHAHDQVETFFLRLMRGSGLEGLTAMRALTPLTDKVDLVRPLLSVSSYDLMAFLEEIGQPWITDPSNDNHHFDRIKVRKLLGDDSLGPHFTQRVVDATNALQDCSTALDFYVEEWLRRFVWPSEFYTLRIAEGAFDSAPTEVVRRGVIKLLAFMSGAAYQPRQEKLSRFIERLKDPSCQNVMLGGVQCCRSTKGDWLAFHEAANLDAVALDKGVAFHALCNVTKAPLAKNLSIGPLGQKGWAMLVGVAPQVKDMKIPTFLREGLPAIWGAEGQLLCVPDCGFYTDGLGVDSLTIARTAPNWLTKA